MVLQIALWEFALVIFLLVLTVLVILLIPVLLNFRKTLIKISTLTDNLNKELPDILADISEITYQASLTSGKINNVVEDIAEIEKKISSDIKEPLLQVVGALGGFLKAFQIFVTYFLRKKK
jgi:predicted PurR-regulated permease PerM